MPNAPTGDPHPSAPSRTLITAALAGLLCIGTSACNSSNDSANTPGTGGSAGATGSGGGAGTAGSGGSSGAAGTAGSGGAAGSAGSGGASGSGGAGGSGGASGAAGSGGSGGATPDAGPDATLDATLDSPTTDAAAVACEGGLVPDAGITSSTVVPGLTLATFTNDCDTRGGTVEIMPHCGGYNSCRGMSYDSGTQVLTEHSCRGLNTCAGFSCIICT